MNDIMEKLEEMMNNSFIMENYIDKDINHLIEQLETAKVEAVTETKKESIINKLHKQIYSLRIITKIFYTKKISKNPKDIVLLGQYLQKVGKDIETIVENE